MTVAPNKACNYLVAETKRSVLSSLSALTAEALASNSVLAIPAFSVVPRSITCHRTPSGGVFVSDIRITMCVPLAQPRGKVGAIEQRFDFIGKCQTHRNDPGAETKSKSITCLVFDNEGRLPPCGHPLWLAKSELLSLEEGFSAGAGENNRFSEVLFTGYRVGEHDIAARRFSVHHPAHRGNTTSPRARNSCGSRL